MRITLKIRGGVALLLGVFVAVSSVGCVGQTPAPVVEQTLDGESLSLAWTHDTGGPINKSPLRVGDVVIVAPVKGALKARDS